MFHNTTPMNVSKKRVALRRHALHGISICWHKTSLQRKKRYEMPIRIRCNSINVFTLFSIAQE